MNRRIPPSTRPGRAARAALGSVVVLLALLAGCNDPNAPAPGSPPGELDFRGDYDGNQALVFQLEAPGDVSLQLLASNITYEPLSGELHAQVSLRNAGTAEVEGPGLVLVGGFDPSEVYPLNAEPLPCPACPMCPCPWPWAFDHAGTYGADGLLGPGETSTPVEWILHVPSGQSFSFRARVERGPSAPRPGVISGTVFTDANRNGVRDPSETGIAGALLSLTHGETGASAVSDANGHYEFDVSEEGLYEVSWDSAGCAMPTTPLRRQIFIVRRPDGSLSGYDRADFGCAGDTPPDSTGVEVQGLVFEDLNRNGVADPGEHGIPGVRIDGAAPNCPTLVPIVAYTNELGLYRLQLMPCEPPYVIQREPLPGFVDTTPNPVVFDGPVPGPGPAPGPGMGSHPRTHPSMTLRADFGVARESTAEFAVEGYVYLDTNHNGQYDEGDLGMADIGVTAAGTECMTPVLGRTTTDQSGHYVLRQTDVHCIPPWLVGHDPIVGHCDTSPNPVLVGAFRMPPDGSMARVDFGVAPCDTIPPPQGFAIDGFVWYDADRDGVHDSGEEGVAGARVELVSPCERLWFASTNESGYYKFDSTGWCPIHAVVQTQPAGLLHTTPNPHPVDPNVVPPGGVLHVDFGVLPMRRQ